MARPERLDAAKATRDELLNLALDVELEWGPNSTRPGVERLVERAVGLDGEQAEALLATASAASGIIFGVVYDGWDGGDNANALCDEGQAKMLEKHPWVDDDNLAHLRNQACYYAWHG